MKNSRKRHAAGDEGEALLVTAVLLLALNLRGPVVAVAAVTGGIADDLRVDATTLGLFTSLPVLCFGLGAPLASVVLARLGVGRGVLLALCALGTGILVRSSGGLGTALAGTVIMGLAVSVSNVAVPMVIGHHLPRRAATVLGAYGAFINLGSMLALGITAPLERSLGWRAALAGGVGLVALASAAWWLALRGSLADTSAAADVTAGPGDVSGGWWRNPVVWGLTLSFACLAFCYLGITAWLPLVLHDRAGLSTAGAPLGSTVFQLASVLGGLGFPLLMRGPRRRVPLVLSVSAAMTVLPLGLLSAPALWTVWCAVGGAAQGSGLTLVLSLVVERARDLRENRRWSALVQGAGYLVAAPAAALIGGVHDATGGWHTPLLVITAVGLALAPAGLVAALRGHTAPAASAGGARAQART
ncbi:MFS transporter [Streptomyces fuscichromogenes]|uniref:MFS transporter n=1 Tax=Streptomyces fuscichromogenes TaxID=1324013 RepID=A0A917XGS3_9ACTN|nr:MFS transporter [Streptomyces fuscichromogenes]GGN20396.1 MFS transporter [Streptomyces fuscichromogenes]